jgi:L,D-transpeptidase catalytic domain
MLPPIGRSLKFLVKYRVIHKFNTRQLQLSLDRAPTLDYLAILGAVVVEILVTKKSIFRLGMATMATLAFMTASASATKVLVVISKVSQHMTVTVDGQQEYNWLVSTGGTGYDTPSGTFHPFRLEKEHFSKEWDDAPMPYSMFFTGEGHAIHGSFHTKRLGTRASHGCVRLAPENAATLFALVEKAGYKNSTFQINGGLFDFGDDNTSNRDFLSTPRKPFKFFWEANKPPKKAVDGTVKKKKKFKSIFASNL